MRSHASRLCARVLSKQRRLSSSLSNKLFPGGPPGLSSFNGRVVTVFGGYGFLGQKVIANLGRIGTQVVVPSRGSYHNTSFLKVCGDLGQIHIMDFEPYDIESVRSCMRYCDTVINCSGQQYLARFAKRSNIDVACNIAKAVSSSPNVRRFIHLSCLTQNQKPADVVSRTKHFGEKLVRAECPHAIVIRPSVMYDANDNFIRRMALDVSPWFMAEMGRVRSVVKYPVSMKDVAKAITIIAMDEEKHRGATFEFYGPESYYLGDIFAFVTQHNIVHPRPRIDNFILPFLKALSSKLFGFDLSGLSRTSPTLGTPDVPSKDTRIRTFADINFTPWETEEGITMACAMYRPMRDHYPHYIVDYVWEQPNVRLIPKGVMDRHNNGR